MVEINLISYLLNASPADATVDELVERIGSRVYPEVLAPETCLPAITYTRISSTHDELLDGGTDLKFGTFQFTCWATTALAAWELASLVRTRLTGIGGDGFQKAGILDERSDYESDTKLYRSDVDIRIAYAESSPE